MEGKPASLDRRGDRQRRRFTPAGVVAGGGCATDVQSGGATLPLTLHIVNGDWLNTKIENSQGYLQRWLGESRSDEELISAFYQLALCRPPELRELRHWVAKLEGENQQDRSVLYADFLWALLNAAEFCCNH